jgi:hypothetical protein
MNVASSLALSARQRDRSRGARSSGNANGAGNDESSELLPNADVLELW